MARPLVIVGTGGMGREVHDLVQAINVEGTQFKVLGFLDSDPSKRDQLVQGVPVLGDLDWLSEHCSVEVAIGLGSPRQKRRVDEAVRTLGASFATLIHPAASVGRQVEIGEGSIVCASAVVTTDVSLGRHVTLNVGSTISHDCRICDFATLAPGVHIAGAVTLGEGADIGIGAVTIQGLTVGAWSIVGAGASVVRDVEPDVTVVGVPARVIKVREAGWERDAVS